MVALVVRAGSLLGATAAATAIASAAWTGAAAPDSGIRGRVVPCGIVHERAACPRDPRAVRLRVSRAADGRAIATVRPDANGRFRVAVRAGTYLVEASSGAPGQAVRVRVAVRAHAWTTVTLPAGRLSPGPYAVSRG